MKELTLNNFINKHNNNEMFMSDFQSALVHAEEYELASQIREIRNALFIKDNESIKNEIKDKLISLIEATKDEGDSFQICVILLSFSYLKGTTSDLAEHMKNFNETNGVSI